MIGLLSAWASLFVAYLVLAGQASADEVAAGVLCASAAVAWWIAARRASPHRFIVEAAAWAALGRAGRGFPRATLSVAATLLRAGRRDAAGAVSRRVFLHGKQADPVERGRRAMGVLAASIAPDAFVLRTPAERDTIVLHRLSGAEPANDPRWPI